MSFHVISFHSFMNHHQPSSIMINHHPSSINHPSSIINNDHPPSSIIIHYPSSIKHPSSIINNNHPPSSIIIHYPSSIIMWADLVTKKPAISSKSLQRFLQSYHENWCLKFPQVDSDVFDISDHPKFPKRRGESPREGLLCWLFKGKTNRKKKKSCHFWEKGWYQTRKGGEWNRHT